jgi:1-acyl-sn-glycerol-3-phosphate acyltransferase
MVIRSLLELPFWLYKIFRYADIEKYDEATGYGLLYRLTKKTNRRGRVTIKCYGLDNLPKDNGYVMYSNHQGMFDALILLETHERPFATVSKKEVENIFFIKQIFVILRSKFIDREDVRQSMKVMMEVTKEVKEGRNYLIFPEGTRSKNQNQIQEFKGGSFKCAMNAKAPIVPIAIIDSYKSFDTHSIAKLMVQIHYLEPLYYEDYQSMKSGEIAELVAGRIEKTIKEFEPVHG